MTRIVDQLLAVARLESGQVLLDDTVDLDDVALHAVAERAPLALAAGRSIELVPQNVRFDRAATPRRWSRRWAT